MLPERPETFRPGPVECPRPGPGLLERGRRENRQCKGKGNAPIIFQHPQYRLKVSLEEQTRKKGGERLRKE